MKAKAAVTVLLLAFVVASVAYVFIPEKPEENLGVKVNASKPAPAPADETQVAPRQVVVYYFHGNTRCQTCRTIEAYTEETVKTAFEDELQNHRLVWQPMNVESTENQHFIEDYQLRTRSVVLVELQDGKQIRWKNLEKVWQLVQDKDAFFNYIQEETGEFLAGV
ncbi:MAG TPA: nitrophenyl compound nitroreductase subunit ArsF family protein [bacterium]|nr:nitrophenyl compound nitroreductase subunit ArsF family protein [bacterium]